MRKNQHVCLGARHFSGALALSILWFFCWRASAQLLINVDFGVGSLSRKSGWAAAGCDTNDYWNLYRHYDPKFVPGMPLVASGQLTPVRLVDGAPTEVVISVTNAPGVWGNATGDAMMDDYIFARDGSNIVVTVSRLTPGRYQFYLYGHADADVTPEQNSVFALKSGTNQFGPFASIGSPGWKASQPWQERQQYVVFRDVTVFENQPVIINVAAGRGGVPVLNGMQILSRGTSPPELTTAQPLSPPPMTTNLLFHSIRYRGVVSDTEARFAAVATVESLTTNEVSSELFEGDLAVQIQSLPEGLRLSTQGKRVFVTAASPGIRELHVEVLARIVRQEPWNRISFTGPKAAVASIEAHAADSGMELQLTGGIAVGGENGAREKSSHVEGVIGADGVLGLRWQSRAAEIARKALLSVQTSCQSIASPTVIKYSTTLKYDILQANLSSLAVQIPTAQALTQLKGDQIRDWQVKTEAGNQILSVEFVKPVEKSYTLALFSEQALQSPAQPVELVVPQPVAVERETGELSIAADDTVVEIETINGLRQVNAPQGVVAAYRFNKRPASLFARLKRIEPVISAEDRLTVRLEESRQQAWHQIGLTVEKTGVYSLEASIPSGFKATTVRGGWIENWKADDSRLRIQFHKQVLGQSTIEVMLEQAFKEFPTQVVVSPLRIKGATVEKAQIGVAAIPGSRLKTAEMTGLGEIPILNLKQRSDEQLAYAADQGGWQLTMTAERLPARCVADVFNLIAVGDGLVGGSATLRYGILNQGIQELRVRIPEHWKNVEFTGPGIRRKDKQDNDWVIGLQEKVWGGYTLVVTYDFPFDPKGGSLSVGGAHAVNVERENGSIAITGAPGMQLKPADASEPLRRMDEAELSSGDRALITRPVLFAYRYSGDSYRLIVEAKCHEELPILDAVADRIQITTALTEDGQMLTQASFMVKNNAKQYQRFRLPNGAEFWSCHVNNLPAKAERDGDWLLAPLPQGENKDQAFAVDLVYAQKLSASPSWRPGRLFLEAPGTDVPNTYAEWQLYVRPSQHLSGFGGSMAVAPGALYEWRDAWKDFMAQCRLILQQGGVFFAGAAGLALVMALMLIAGMRRGWNGVVLFIVLLAVAIVMVGMLLPSMVKGRATAQHSSAVPAVQERFADEIAQVPAGGLDAEVKSAELRQDVQEQMRATLFDNRAATNAVAVDGRLLERWDQANSDIPGLANMADGRAGGAAAAEKPASAAAALPQRAAPPMAAGVRPIRIEIPRDGVALSFTKVLNIGEEPLTISARIMSTASYLRWRALAQAAIFLLGCVLLARQWISGRANSLQLLLSLLFVGGSVGHFLLTHRVLDVALLLFVPMLAFAMCAWMLWVLWPKRKPAPPVVAAGLVLLLSMDARGQSATAADLETSTNGVVVVSNLMEGRVQDSAATIDAVIRLNFSKTNQLCPLFGQDFAIQHFQADPAQAQLWRQGDFVCVRYPGTGEVTVKIKGLARLFVDASHREIKVKAPPALYSHLNLVLDEPDAEVEFPSALAFQIKPDGKRTLVDAVLGSGDGIDLRWAPRMKKAAEVAATVFCRNNALVTIGNGAVNARSRLEYQISQGELRRLRVRIPSEHRLLRVEGDAVRAWEQAEENGLSVVQVDLLKNNASSYRIDVETEAPLQKLPASIQIGIPHALDVKRETGAVAVKAGEELNVSVDAGSLQRIDIDDFARATGVDSSGIAGAFRFLDAGFALTAAAEMQVPQVEAVYRNVFHIRESQLRLTAAVQFSTKKAGVFKVKVKIPSEYRIEKIDGQKVMQWHERQTNGMRLVEITLKEQTLGSIPVRLDLVLPWSSLPKTVSANGVVPLDTSKSTGYLSVTADPGIAVKTLATEKLSEIPASNLSEAEVPVVVPRIEGQSEPAGKVQVNQSARAVPQPPPPGTSGAVLAFKCIADDRTAADWKLEVGTETLESWIRAETAQHITITESLVTGRARIRLDVANAPAKQFALNIPSSLKNVEIAGANIRRRDQSNELWRVELQNKVQGYYLLTVTWEQSRSNPTNSVEAAFVSVAGAERETGIIGIEAKPPLQAVAKTVSDLARIDSQDIPDWAQRSSFASSMVYRYLRPGARLTMDVRRYQEAEVLQALADSAQYASVIAEDGQVMTAMTLQVRNNGRQHLEMDMPAGTKIWSAFVGGSPVKPSEQAGRILLPLEKTASEGSLLSVEVVYTGKAAFPRKSGLFELASPKLDLPLKNARWELYLPQDYRFFGFGGTMVHQERGEQAPVVLRYTQSDYEQQEKAKKIAIDTSAMSNLLAARSSLKKGNVKDAVDNYRQVRAQQQALNPEASEQLKQIESDIRRMNANSLNDFQNIVTIAGTDGSQAIEFVPGQTIGTPFYSTANTTFNNEDAERQWVKLQQAQEVETAKVQPLRVNLPKRGQVHVFAQLLQTEVRKPMTIRFHASSLKSGGQFRKIMAGGAALLGLWLAIALVRRTTQWRRKPME